MKTYISPLTLMSCIGPCDYSELPDKVLEAIEMLSAERLREKLDTAFGFGFFSQFIVTSFTNTLIVDYYDKEEIFG